MGKGDDVKFYWVFTNHLEEHGFTVGMKYSALTWTEADIVHV